MSWIKISGPLSKNNFRSFYFICFLNFFWKSLGIHWNKSVYSIENKDASENVTDDNDTEQDTDLELVENGDTESPADTETEPSTASISDFNPRMTFYSS